MTTPRSLGEHDPSLLVEERIQLHYGVWILGSIAHSILPAQDDDGHTNLDYDADGARFSTRPLSEETRARVSLEIDTLSLVVERGGAEVARLELEGRSFDAALDQVSAELSAVLSSEVQVKRREYPDFPGSPLADGAAFSRGDRSLRLALDGYYALASGLFEDLAMREATMTPPRTWPHHFDHATTLPMADGALIGLGLSPGDASFPEPYLYAYPYPYPSADALPDLAVGRWNVEGFTAAVLPASSFVGHGDPVRTAARFLDGAVAACRLVLGFSCT